MLISIVGGCQFSTEINKICGYIFIDRVALAKQGDNILGSVRLSVRQCALSPLNRLKSHYQSRVFVCVSRGCGRSAFNSHGQ